MESLRSSLLLASPALADGNFYRTVVMMISHDDEGALGVILNRPSDIPFADLWTQYTGNPCNSTVRIHRGGPVEGPPILLHDDAARGETELTDGVFLSTEESNVDWLINHLPNHLKVFCGYAGWGPGQLDHELAHGGWLTARAKPEFVFSDDEELWKLIAAEIGGHVVFQHSRSGDEPIDPSLN